MGNATKLIARLGAYCPRVKYMEDIAAFERLQAMAKRRTRPMLSRGTTALFLKDYYDQAAWLGGNEDARRRARNKRKAEAKR